MTINADKSMDFIMIEAIDQSLFESEEFQETTNEKMIEKLKRAGFQIENYYEEGKRGYQITKHFKNIDDVSTREELVADLGLENLAEVGMLFQVKPGFLKNQYQAKFTTQEQNLLIGDAQTENTEDDFSDLKEQLEIQFSVKLPHKPLTANASITEENGKMLTWNLLDMQEDNIAFSFELYNLETVIFIIIGGIFFLILLFALFHILIRPKKKRILPEFSENSSFSNSNF